MLKYQEIIDDKYDKRLSNFIIGYYFVQAINLFVKLVIGGFPSWPLISKGVLALLLFISLVPISKREFGRAILIEGFFAVLFGVSILLGNTSWGQYGDIIINSLTVFVPMCISAICIKNPEILLQRMYYVSWPIQIVLLVVLFGLKGRDYSMPGGYALCFQIMIVLDHFLKERKWYDLIAVIVGIIAIVIFGSRGPIVCFGAMVILHFLTDNISLKMKLLLIISTILVSVLVFAFHDSFINALIGYLSNRGFISRNLELLLAQNISYDSGRDYLYNYYIEKIKMRPLVGYGLAGGWISRGFYPHNLFLELLLSFGIVIGIIVIIYLLIRIIKGIKQEDEIKKRINIILISYSVSLLFSDSFLMCPMFFLLLAFTNVFCIKVRVGE